MQLFTYMDHLNGVCLASEIDTPWQSRWSNSDLSRGLCDGEEVGKAKPATGETVVEQTFVSLSREDRKRLTQELSDKLLILAHSNPAQFMDGAGPQINKFLDAAQKLAEEEKQLVITDDTDLSRIATSDLRRYLFKQLSPANQAELLAQ